MTEISDYELIYMIRQGDDAAFSQLLQRYDECSRHLIFHFIRHDIAYNNKDDFRQLAAMKMLQAIQCYREDRQVNFASFYQNILRRALIDYLRVNKQILMTQGYGSVYDNHICDGGGQYTTNSSKNETISKSVLLRIEEAMEHLNAFEKKIVELRKNGYTYAEIATDLKISEYIVARTIRKIRNAQKKSR